MIERKYGKKHRVIQALLVLRQSIRIGRFTTQIAGYLSVKNQQIAAFHTDVLFEDADSDIVRFEIESNEIEKTWALSFDCSQSTDQLTVATGDSKPSPPFVPEDWEEVPPFGHNLLYVDAERVGPRKFHPLSEAVARRVDFGSGCEYALNYLSLNQNMKMPEDDPRCFDLPEHREHSLMTVANHWLQGITPGARVELEAVPAADALIAGFSFDRPGDVPTRRFRAINVGFGLSYTLPVILALLAEPGTLCLIENPEAHLHPRGQTKLAELAVCASLADVQVIVETHSDHFMDGVRIAVRDGLISPNKTAIRYFERPNVETVVASPKIDDDGRLSTWPAGFFDQHEENLEKLLAPKY